MNSPATVTDLLEDGAAGKHQPTAQATHMPAHPPAHPPAPQPLPQAASSIPLHFIPQTEAELTTCLADPMWRVASGYLYKIMVKSDEGRGSVVAFVPNRAQRRFMARLWHRNLILKARQLGFTTLVAILWLDHALFNSNQRCGIIAQDREAAEVIFRDKVKLAYEHLPLALRRAMPLARDNTSELLFAHNNSSVRVATSMRSGTIHRLHISEFGKICSRYKDKAAEIVTGSLPAVPLDGITIIESTAEGQEGDFYEKTRQAMALQEQGTRLSARDFRFHFYPWWQEPGYRLASSVVLSSKDQEYFASIEASMACQLDAAQRQWYVATRNADFSGDPEKMWQEYPSTPQEAFKVSTEGTYYAVQLSAMRKEGRLSAVPVLEGVPVNTFWDIGNTDGTAIWLHQKQGLQHRFIGFIEGWGEPYAYYIKQLQALGYVWGKHFLPHDAAHKRQQGHSLDAPIDLLEKMQIGGSWHIVPRVPDIQHGIQLSRAALAQCWFDEATCQHGIAHLAGYKKTWNTRQGRWNATPDHNIHSEAADAFRQFAQSLAHISGGKSKLPPRQRNWRTT